MTQYINYDPNNNNKIISVTQGQREIMYYPQVAIPDGVNTANTKLDTTQVTPVLVDATTLKTIAQANILK